MTVTSSLPSPASAPLAVRTTPPSANRGSRWFLKWTLAAKVTAASARVNVIDKITGRFIDFSPSSGPQDVSETSPPALPQEGGALGVDGRSAEVARLNRQRMSDSPSVRPGSRANSEQ